MALHLLLSPLISSVVQKAGNSLIEQFCQMNGMKENREKLHRQLRAIQKVIGNAEERGANELDVQAWLKELNAVAYKAVDVLDEFQYEALRRLAHSQEPSSSTKKITKSIILRKNPILFRYKMSTKLKKVLEKINEIISEMKTFSFIAHAPQPIIRTPPTHSYVIKSEVIGRDGEKEKIMNILLDSNREMESVSVLPIVGMGGAGKTTLAQLVYSEEKVKEYFTLLMWVCVSNDFNVVNIVKSIIEVVTNGQSVSTSNFEVLQNRLREILAGKKYLLVLDDVWNEDIQKWDALKTLMFSGVCLGSVIVVTTRSKKVASIMGTMVYHDLAMLSEEDSWSLFRKRAFCGAEEQQEFVKIGRTICGKCAGLPLALKTIGGLMRTKRDVREWRSILQNKIWDGEASANGILPALKLSYDQLSSDMKQCFAFCAIFPHDYEIEKERLIQLWMANDLIQNDEIMDLEDKGGYIFEELCRRSFFQDIRRYEYGGDQFQTEVLCKMHDLMHNLAKHVAGKQCASTLEVESDQVRHLSIMGVHSLNNLNSLLKEFSIIQTCLINRGFANESENGKHFDSMKPVSLRALQMKYTNQLPKELGYMKHLRYLDLSRSNFDSLPEITSTLYNLQTLNLSWSKISKLPEGMRYMISLRHLFINNCPNLKRMPTDLGQLRCLRTLTNYMIEYDPGRNIGQLNNFNLHGVLRLSGLENVRDKNEAKAANMISKTNLSSLYLTWCSLDNKDTTRNDQEVLDGLRQSTETKYLNINGYIGFGFPIWMKEMFVMRNLRELHLVNCCNCTALPPVWHFPVLERLVLINLQSFVYICCSQSIEDEESEHLTMFLHLKSLCIDSLVNLEGWHDKDDKLVAFPQLDKLYIKKCPKIRTIPYAPLLRDLNISNSREIKLVEISNLSMIASSELIIHYESSTEPDEFRPPKNVVKMIVYGFENVIPLEENEKETCQEMTLRDLTINSSNCFFSRGPSKLSLGFWRHFASLEILDIWNCNALSFWPEKEFKNLKSLKILGIYSCDKLTCLSQVSPSSVKSCGEDSLPRLENLEIMWCPKLVEIPSCSKSLKTLALEHCPSLSKEGLNWMQNLHELKELKLLGCVGLESLPDGLESLTSLERLSIRHCPGIAAFPQGLRQQLSALQYLEIEECSALESHCRSGGNYHQLVSDIPQLIIGTSD